MEKVLKVIESQRQSVGKEVVTDWVTLDQRSVDVFSALTGDYAFQHNDPKWAREVGRFGGRTIAHGLLGASLIPWFMREFPDSIVMPSDQVNILNYGIDSLRFVSPIFVGIPLRARLKLLGLEERSKGRFLFTYSVIMEQEGSERPCLVGRSLVMVLLDGTGLDGSPSSGT